MSNNKTTQEAVCDFWDNVFADHPRAQSRIRRMCWIMFSLGAAASGIVAGIVAVL